MPHLQERANSSFP